ncbi:MAG TPA: hypothetical protein VL134_06470 [Leptolyngbya sp.]|jgi:hypothetical protein|nr:hypothetical protein [Leptolyngbya sp.]
MTTLTALTAFDTVAAMLADSRQTIDDINQACVAKGLPLAFDVGEDLTSIKGNRDYRFEGFGLVIGLPPKLSFWVHYQPGSANQVEIGKFTMPVNLGKLSSIRSLIGKL